MSTNSLTRGAIIAALYAALTLLLAPISYGEVQFRLAEALTVLPIVLPEAVPALFNGVIVGSVVHFCYAPVIPLPLCMLSVAAGEAAVCLLAGPAVLAAIRRIPAKMLLR